MYLKVGVSVYNIIAIGIIGLLLFSSQRRLSRYLERRSMNIIKVGEKFLTPEEVL
jgi:hypothetical protein